MWQHRMRRRQVLTSARQGTVPTALAQAPQVQHAELTKGEFHVQITIGRLMTHGVLTDLWGCYRYKDWVMHLAPSFSTSNGNANCT